MEQKPVAVFDIDGTIFRSSLLIKLVEELIARGDFPAEARDVYKAHESAWVARSGTYEEYIQKVIDAFTKYVAGLPVDALYEAAHSVNATQHELRYRYTSKLLKDLKAQNYFLLAVSQSPWAVLEDFCRNLGFDKVYGRFYEQDEAGKLTGVVKSEDMIRDKAVIVRRAVEKNNLTLVGSIGVGDTEGDIPMLSVVERPICFNPNAKLAEKARAEGWDIVIERKDVMYEWSGKTGEMKIL